MAQQDTYNQTQYTHRQCYSEFDFNQLYKASHREKLQYYTKIPRPNADYQDALVIMRQSNSQRLLNALQSAQERLPQDAMVVVLALRQPDKLAEVASMLAYWLDSSAVPLNYLLDISLPERGVVLGGSEAKRLMQGIVGMGHLLLSADSSYAVRLVGYQLARLIQEFGSDLVLGILTRQAWIRLNEPGGVVEEGVVEEFVPSSAQRTLAMPKAVSSAATDDKPEIPKGCEYLVKGETVEADSSQFDRIRSPAVLSPDTKQIDYAFRGSAVSMPATVHTAIVKGEKIEIIAPNSGALAGRHIPSPEQVAAALGTVPAKQLETIKQMTINPVQNPDDAYWAQQYNMPDFSSGATGGNNGVTFYPSRGKWSQNSLDSTMIHESDHTYSQVLWANLAEKERWKNIVKSDKNTPSNYAEASVEEDFSESLVMYSLSKYTKCEETAKKIFPARYKQLDKLLQ
ncbi:hypothetical protein HZU77_015195 [Neisseriaceae bacterium TC5R-5]|nr:hypothetical protein [Neisseriaceae bacterium TC5R-5]